MGRRIAIITIITIIIKFVRANTNYNLRGSKIILAKSISNVMTILLTTNMQAYHIGN